MRRAASLLPAVVLLALAAGAVLAQPQPAAPAGDQEAMMRLFHALRPKIIIELGEQEINACLRQNPADFGIPAGFADPRVAFGGGLVAVSARAQVLFFTSRVSVAMAPEIVRGRLRLVVRKVHASGIRLPTYFHRGVADAITGLINPALERNELTLTGVEVERGLVRVTAQVTPQTDPGG
jgi:hypothetical protein